MKTSLFFWVALALVATPVSARETKSTTEPARETVEVKKPARPLAPLPTPPVVVYSDGPCAGCS